MEQKAINASVLEVLARDQDLNESVIGEDRVSYFLSLAVSTPEKDFSDAVRDFKNAHKIDGKVERVASVRASEFQTLFYGQLHNAALDNLGYHAAINKARAHLQAQGLRGNGKPILSEEERQANREKNLRRKAANEAAKLIDFGDENALVKLQEKTQEVLAKLKADQETEALAKKYEKVTSLVKSIMDDGPEYAQEVFAQLSKALGYSIEETEEQFIEQQLKAA